MLILNTLIPDSVDHRWKCIKNAIKLLCDHTSFEEGIRAFCALLGPHRGQTALGPKRAPFAELAFRLDGTASLQFRDEVKFQQMP